MYTITKEILMYLANLHDDIIYSLITYGSFIPAPKLCDLYEIILVSLRAQILYFKVSVSE